MLLKLRRAKLPTQRHASWKAVTVAAVCITAGIIGNLVNRVRSLPALVLFGLIFVLPVQLMLNRVQVGERGSVRQEIGAHHLLTPNVSLIHQILATASHYAQIAKALRSSRQRAQSSERDRASAVGAPASVPPAARLTTQSRRAAEPRIEVATLCLVSLSSSLSRFSPCGRAAVCLEHSREGGKSRPGGRRALGRAPPSVLTLRIR